MEVDAQFPAPAALIVSPNDTVKKKLISLFWDLKDSPINGR
jgi:hypothetical protein